MTVNPDEGRICVSRQALVPATFGLPNPARGPGTRARKRKGRE